MILKTRILSITDPHDRKREIAYWVVNTLYDIRREVPIAEPDNWKQYKAMPTAKQKELSALVCQDPDIAEYLDSVWKARISNRDNIKWLDEARSWLPNDDLISKDKIDKKIEELGGRVLLTKAIEINWND